MKRDKVVINIYHNISSQELETGILNNILYGIEEEGIPYRLESYPDRLDSPRLARRAAEESQLNIGIGIDRNGNACIKHVNFRDNQNLFPCNIWEDEANLRKLGMNSARLFKGVPFNL